MSAPYMPLYVADYLGATQHLSTFESGAYLHLLMCMWIAGGRLPNDPRQLSRCAKITLEKWRGIAPIILPFFTVEGDFLTQKKLAKLQAGYENTRAARVAAGLAGSRAKALKRNKPGEANASGLHKPRTTNQNQTPTEEEPSRVLSSDRRAPETLERWLGSATPALRESGLDPQTIAFAAEHFSPAEQDRLAVEAGAAA